MLLDLAFKALDDDFARLLVTRYRANPGLCIETVWFAEDMQKLYDALPVATEPEFSDSRVVNTYDALPVATEVSDLHTRDAAPSESNVPAVIRRYDEPLRLAEDTLRTWQSAPGSFSSFATLITRIDNLMHRFVDYLAAMPQQDLPGFIATEYSAWYAKFEGYIGLEFALREKIADALRSGNKELALSYCAIIREMAPYMKDEARYNLLRGIKMDGGRGHALSIFSIRPASNYQRLCGEDPAFYTEFKAMKVLLSDSLNGVKLSPRLQSTNILQAIDCYQQLRLRNSGARKSIKAYAELLAFIPEGRVRLINDQYLRWRDISSSKALSLPYGLAYAMRDQDKELALSYIDIAELVAPNMRNEERFVLRQCITPDDIPPRHVYFFFGISTKLCEDPTFNTKFRRMNAQLEVLLGGWRPPTQDNQGAGSGDH